MEHLRLKTTGSLPTKGWEENQLDLFNDLSETGTRGTSNAGSAHTHKGSDFHAVRALVDRCGDPVRAGQRVNTALEELGSDYRMDVAYLSDICRNGGAPLTLAFVHYVLSNSLENPLMKSRPG